MLVNVSHLGAPGGVKVMLRASIIHHIPDGTDDPAQVHT